MAHNMNSKIENERSFHNKRFSGDDKARAGLSKYYSINLHPNAYFNSRVSEVCCGAELLDYGCGTGESAFHWEKYGAKVTGIDISDEGIKEAKKLAKDRNIHIEFLQMDAEDLSILAARSFDVVTGISILHHLDINNAYREISRVLRKNGRAVFFEPLGHNAIMNLFRKLKSSYRTKDEHPLLMIDIEAAKHFFGKVRTRHFHILALLAIPFRHSLFFNKMLHVLGLIDNGIMSIFPFLRRYAWIVVIELLDPL